MENQNGFDLEKALRAWRQDCANQPAISRDNARELENHLREALADLLKQGLSEEPAFYAAVRQVGAPDELAQEFARENPLAVWRERLFWMAMAGFAISLWNLMIAGPLLSAFNALGELMHMSLAAWLALAGQLPVLLVGVLLATGYGRLKKPLRGFQRFLQSRPRFALAGAGSLVICGLLRLFGPSHLQLPNGSLMTTLFLVDVFSWPLVLLAVSMVFLRSNPAGDSDTAFASAAVPPPVWRDRVLWMAMAGLAIGLWQRVSFFGITALFYTGDISRPYNVSPLLLMGVQMLILFSPLLAYFIAQQLRAGNAFTLGMRVQRRALFGLVPVMLCAWAAVFAWSTYLTYPQGIAFSWRGLFWWSLTSFQWLWPAGLAALIVWLAPRDQEQEQYFETTAP